MCPRPSPQIHLRMGLVNAVFWSFWLIYGQKRVSENRSAINRSRQVDIFSIFFELTFLREMYFSIKEHNGKNISFRLCSFLKCFLAIISPQAFRIPA